MQNQIALYTADGELSDWITEQRLVKLQAAGLIARVVRHRKGRINRAILFRHSREAQGVELKDYLGTRYSYREHLENGYIAWALKKLGKGDELRPIFLRVVADCLASQ